MLLRRTGIIPNPDASTAAYSLSGASAILRAYSGLGRYGATDILYRTDVL
jgi:hypothetical protein